MSNTKYKSFQDMDIWKKAMQLSVDIFKLTIELPKCEDYGLISQIRRSANSVHANIAEGFGCSINLDKNKFYIGTRGSVFETQNHLIYGNQVGYFMDEIIAKLLSEYDTILHDINRLIKTLYNK